LKEWVTERVRKYVPRLESVLVPQGQPGFESPPNPLFFVPSFISFYSCALIVIAASAAESRLLHCLQILPQLDDVVRARDHAANVLPRYK